MKLPKRAERRHRGLVKFIKRLQHQIDTTNFGTGIRGSRVNGWNDVEAYKKDNPWVALLKHTAKLCSCDSCCNNRHSRWHKGKAKLTKQERKALDDFKQQLELLNENPDS